MLGKLFNVEGKAESVEYTQSHNNGTMMLYRLLLEPLPHVTSDYKHLPNDMV